MNYFFNFFFKFSLLILEMCEFNLINQIMLSLFNISNKHV